MRKFINLAAALIGVANIAWHLTKRRGMDERLFGFEVNEYIYLAFWVVITVLCFSQFMRQHKIDSSKNS